MRTFENYILEEIDCLKITKKIQFNMLDFKSTLDYLPLLKGLFNSNCLDLIQFLKCIDELITRISRRDFSTSDINVYRDELFIIFTQMKKQILLNIKLSCK